MFKVISIKINLQNVTFLYFFSKIREISIKIKCSSQNSRFIITPSCVIVMLSSTALICSESY